MSQSTRVNNREKRTDRQDSSVDRRYRSALHQIRSRDVSRAPHERLMKYDRENDLYERQSI